MRKRKSVIDKEEQLINRFMFLETKNDKGEFKTVESFIKFVNNDKTLSEDVLLFSTSKKVINNYLMFVKDLINDEEMICVEDLVESVNQSKFSLLREESYKRIKIVRNVLIFFFICVFIIGAIFNFSKII